VTNCATEAAEAAAPTRSHGATTLKDLGISKTQSSRWQALANVPERDFEAALDGNKKPTSRGIVARPKRSTFEPGLLAARDQDELAASWSANAVTGWFQNSPAETGHRNCCWTPDELPDCSRNHFRMLPICYLIKNKASADYG